MTVAAAVVGLASVTGGIWLLGARGEGDKDALLPARPGAAVALIVVGLVAWVIGLALALR